MNADDLFSHIEDLLTKRLKEIEEKSVRASNRKTELGPYDDKRFCLFTKALEDLADSKQFVSDKFASLLMLIKQGVIESV